jgi:hypothetical protein
MKTLFAVFTAFLLCTAASAGEQGPVMNGKLIHVKKGPCASKTTCPKEAEARARAALALAQASKPVVATVPEKIQVNKGCHCGDFCECPKGVCPDCIEAGTALTKGLALPKPMPSAAVKPVISYMQQGTAIYEVTPAGYKFIGYCTGQACYTSK